MTKAATATTASEVKAEPDTTLAVMLGFVAGFVDTAGYVALFGLFTAHVTGNFVVIGAALVGQGSGLIAKLLALPMFIVTVGASHVVMSNRLRRGQGVRIPALLLQSGLLAAFLVAGCAGQPMPSAGAPLAMIAGMLGVAAMGIQNAASRVAFRELLPTTVMTGNTTQLVMDGVDLLRGVGDRPAARERFTRSYPVILAFALGAICGAVAIASLGFAALAAPIAILLAGAWRCSRAELWGQA